jgi:hypothetical protein
MPNLSVVANVIIVAAIVALAAIYLARGEAVLSGVGMGAAVVFSRRIWLGRSRSNGQSTGGRS